MSRVETRYWIALALPPLAWFGYQQGLGMTVRTACSAAPPTGWIAGALALLVCALSAWLARPGERFLQKLAIGLAAIFALAIAYHVLAAGIVPPCAR